MKGLRRGTRLGKYRLERRLGEGASAEVWAGRDTVEGRRVAVKVVPPSVVAEFGREAIEHEARLATRLEHPNIVAIRNADWVDPYFLIVCEIAQRSLEGYRMPRRSPELALAILRDAACGLAFAHSRKIIHRDIKPANILLFEGRRAKIADFGTARFAPARTALFTEAGTLGYMAPEQAYGRPGYPSDVFSLGLTGYQLFTGVLPSWPFEQPLEAQRRFEQRVAPEIQRVILKCLAVPTSKRWANAVVFHEALERAVERSRSRLERTTRSRSRTRPTRPRPTPLELEFRWSRREYGASLGLQYECCACDGPIAEAMKHCPWCGTTQNSFAEITSFALVCPDCERGVRPEWEACPWCYAGRFEGNGRKPPHDRAATRKCRRKDCGAELRPFMRYCPMCKTKVTRPWKVEGLTSCRKCRWPLAPRWRFCAWCGRRDQTALAIRSRSPNGRNSKG